MTPREPDRFDAQARELCASHVTYKEIAAALRAAESSALERAAQVVDANEILPRDVRELLIKDIRALIPPAAAPAAETGKAQGAIPVGNCDECGARLGTSDDKMPDTPPDLLNPALCWIQWRGGSHASAAPSEGEGKT